jgi:ketosteroid isomerase-like protein
MKNYEETVKEEKFDLMIPFIDKSAIFWFSDGSFIGINEIREAFEKTWSILKDEIYTISELTWLYQSELSAVCIYKFYSESSTLNGKRVTFKGRGTNVLEKKGEKWKIIHEHLSLEPKMQN